MPTNATTFSNLLIGPSMAIPGRCPRPRGPRTCNSPAKLANCGFSRPIHKRIFTKLSRILVGFSNEGPTHWPLLHRTHVMRSTGKAWGCLGCKQVVGVTSKNLKQALQLPCRSTGRQANLQFASLRKPSLNTTTCPQVRPSAVPPEPPGEAAVPPAVHRENGQSLSVGLGSPSAKVALSGAFTKPRPKPKAKPKVDPAQRTLRF